MKDLLRDWNFSRIFYIVAGIWAVAQSIMDRAWLLLPFGLYFVAMGIFKFGCASGSCEVPISSRQETENQK